MNTLRPRSLKSCWSQPIITTMALYLLAAPLVAQGQSISDSDFKRSIWDTSYESFSGQKVSARMFLRGETGHYDVSGGRGKLSNIKYTIKPAGAAQIEGNWSMGGSNGKFTFFVAANTNPMIFSGAWQSSGRSGNWRGQFEGLQEPNVFTAANNAALASVSYGDWQFNQPKDYYYRVCSFPAGGYQYVIYYPTKPNWVYWYNPVKNVFWCACPTVNHPRWGQGIANGKDLFLLASTKAGDIGNTVFPDAGDDGANFVTGTATDKDGATVELGCPPTDLP